MEVNVTRQLRSLLLLCQEVVVLMLGCRHQQLWDRMVPSAGVHPSILTDAVSLVLGQLKTRPALAGDAAPRSLLADVTTAVILIHAAQTLCRTEQHVTRREPQTCLPAQVSSSPTF